MSFLPICLDVGETKIVVVGGGKVAEQKLRTILLYALHVVVCAPDIADGIRQMKVTCVESLYSVEVLEGAGLVYACTNDRTLNRRVGEDCRVRRIPVCVADDPEACDFVSPAVFRRGNMSVAVSSDAKDPKRSVAWRNRILEVFSHDPLDG